MTDLWSFLLQTLNASGVAVLLLAVKALFKDKLPPKWQFAVWSILGIVLLIPAGWNGRFALVNWQYAVECIKAAVGDFSFIRVLYPIPVVRSAPQTVADWLFLIYAVGVLAHIVMYLVSYIRLRFVLRKGKAASENVQERVNAIAAQLHIKKCRVMHVSGLPSAFVCGVIRPVLAIPAQTDCDDKILLHELMHLKSKDTLWSIAIAVLRSLHWCNPLIVYCAKHAANDMEARCDQFVLEQLEGEERREYGRILLSMVNERFAKTPGTTCVNNGAKSIRNRIESIARFKKYPLGMRLVSVCLLLILGLSAVFGEPVTLPAQTKQAYALTSFASFMSVPCTTYAGALDAYGKAVLTQNGYYRVLCAPQTMRAALCKEMQTNYKNNVFSVWNSGLSYDPDEQGGYYIYNLHKTEEDVYEGLLVIKLLSSEVRYDGEYEMHTLAYQPVRTYKENGRWVTVATAAFRTVDTTDSDISWGCEDLPALVYSATQDNWTAEVITQTFYTVESTVQVQNNQFGFANSTYFDSVPRPNADFTKAGQMHRKRVCHNGTQEERDAVTVIGLSTAAVYPGEIPPESLTIATGSYVSGSNSRGESWSSHSVEPGWGPCMEIGGGGGSLDPEAQPELPAYYVAQLSTDNGFKEELRLTERKGDNG